MTDTPGPTARAIITNRGGPSLTSAGPPNPPETGAHREDIGKSRTSVGKITAADDALSIWASSTDPRGTLAEVYLQTCGLELQQSTAGDVLRFHPSLKLGQARMPALVALFRDVVTDEPRGILGTFLNPDGRTLDRRVFGRSHGAAIKLDADETVTTGLTIGGGLEAVMRARMAGCSPAWALAFSGKVKSFPVLSGLEAVTVLVEADNIDASERALEVFARRWLAAGAEVHALTPRRGSGPKRSVGTALHARRWNRRETLPGLASPIADSLPLERLIFGQTTPVHENDFANLAALFGGALPPGWGEPAPMCDSRTCGLEELFGGTLPSGWGEPAPTREPRDFGLEELFGGTSPPVGASPPLRKEPFDGEAVPLDHARRGSGQI